MNDRHEKTQRQSRRPTTVAIANVTVHTMAARGTLQGQTVVIEDGRVSRMGRVGELPTAGFDVVDGAGRYLVPGLTDMFQRLINREEWIGSRDHRRYATAARQSRN
jgi:imidazolonepropionase-like amidohydrolase